MRLRALLIVVIGACGFLFALASFASADIMSLNDPANPSLPGQSVSERAVPARPSPQPEASPAADGLTSGAAPAEATADMTPAPLAPEHRVARAVKPVRKLAPGTEAAANAPLVVQSRSDLFGPIGAFLREVVRDCKVGVAAATGGPVVLLAVLGAAALLERRRALAVLPLGNERVPEFLYVWDVIAPG